MRLFNLSVCIAVVLVSACSSKNVRQSQSTRVVSVTGGWEQRIPDSLYSSERLKDYVENGAEEFLTKGFVRLVVRRLEHLNYRKPVVIEIYQMNDAQGAKAVYAERKSKEGKQLSVGEDASIYEGGFLLIEAVKGDRYFRIYTCNTAPEAKQFLVSVAQMIVEKK